jgi:hypothetical protein
MGWGRPWRTPNLPVLEQDRKEARGDHENFELFSLSVSFPYQKVHLREKPGGVSKESFPGFRLRDVPKEFTLQIRPNSVDKRRSTAIPGDRHP